MSEAKPERKGALRNPWVIAWIGLVAVVLGANILMIYLSVKANPGLVVEDYYERGRKYEANVRKRLADDPGWLMSIDAPRRPGVDSPSPFRFTVTDGDGRPMTPDRVTLYAYRPSDASVDFAQPMERFAPGEYRTQVRFPLKGAWDVVVAVQHGPEEYNTPLRVNAGVDERR